LDAEEDDAKIVLVPDVSADGSLTGRPGDVP
jgi:hypothetical protein